MQLLNVILGATILGLSIAPYVTLSSFCASGLVAVTGVLLLVLRRRPFWARILVFFLFALLAILRYPQAFFNSPDLDRLAAESSAVEWTGEIRSIETLADGRSRMDVRLETVSLTGMDRILLMDAGTRVYVGGGDLQVCPGDVVRQRSRFRKPRQFGTPGEFNWPRHLRSQGIVLTTWIREASTLNIVARRPSFPRRHLYALRRAVGQFIQGALTGSQAALTRALVLGEGRMLAPETRKLLARAGVSHLFAISGLHIGLVGTFLYIILRQLVRHVPRLLMVAPPQRSLPPVIIPALAVYLLLTGNALATQRAFFLTAVGAVLLIRRYHVNGLQLLASLAALSLLSTPLVLWNAGWQLSFVGAGAILYAGPFLEKVKGRGVLGYLAQLAIVSATATLATLPLVFSHFHMLAPAAVLMNLLAVPAVTMLALPVGMLGLVCYPVSQGLAGVLFLCCGTLLEGLVGLCSMVVAVPALAGRYLFLSRLQIVSIGILVGLCFVLAKYRGRTAVSLSAGGAVLAWALWQCPYLKATEPNLVLFSVGQGESVLLQDGRGRAVLVDGGGLYSDTFDVGERLLAPALAELGVASLDAVVLTHDHPDHRKGLLFILDQIPVGEFWSGRPLDQLDRSLRRTIAANDIPFRTHSQGWAMIPFGQAPLQVFSPGDKCRSENDRSLVVLWRPDGTRGVLLTGDLERAGVAALLGENPGPVDILKLPHHGSRFSRIEDLVQACRPGRCLVSSGYQNRYRLPAESVVRFLEGRRIDLFRTDLDGTIRARARNGEWLVERWENGLFR